MFPKEFLWGAATSSHQVEGGNTKNNWYVAETRGLVPPCGQACDSYHRFKEDFDIASQLGHNCHRLSLEWSRIEPREGGWDMAEVAHYREVLQALRDRGLTSFVTLWHFTLPTWLVERDRETVGFRFSAPSETISSKAFAVRSGGGWENPETIDYFVRYAKFCAENFGDLVDFWITFNEPRVYSLVAYLESRWPPFKKSNYWVVLKTQYLQTLAHRKAYRVIKKILPQSKVSLVENFTYVEPKNPARVLDKFTAWINNYLTNRLPFLLIGQSFDFVGCNYYFRKRVEFGWRFKKTVLGNDDPENLWVSDLGWEIYPRGIYGVLKELARYKKPIFITENGLSDGHDVSRERFLKEHLEWVQKAIDEGIDVRGYIYWSLLDNYEWDSGFGPRFGLVEVDYKDNCYRHIRRSALWLRDFIASSRL